MCKIISIANQKGGTSKTTTTVNLGIGLSRLGNRVLVIDNDPQGSMTASLGYRNPDELDFTLSTVLQSIIVDDEADMQKGILSNPEGIDLMPANIELSGVEVSLVNVMSRELILRQYIEQIRDNYDYILIDCMPSLGMLTINALACADSVLLPVQAAYLSLKGMEQLLTTIRKVRRQLNRKLEIEGILLTMVDFRTNYAKDVCELVRDLYGKKIHIFENPIPLSVRAAEASAEGKSIFLHDPKGKVAYAYEKLALEVNKR
ncbi:MULTISPECIES: ParA family protein [unclassified Ruminococcus]|uniref:ParA family protein n=1 Tax=unclassified Ruminococcus TaxID=2608920 RepID=UPI00319E6024